MFAYIGSLGSLKRERKFHAYCGLYLPTQRETLYAATRLRLRCIPAIDIRGINVEIFARKKAT